MKKHGFKPLFNITNKITAALTVIERARGFLEAATLSEEWIHAMGQRALLLEAHHTSHIEGTRLTVEQAEKAWGGGGATAHPALRFGQAVTSCDIEL